MHTRSMEVINPKSIDETEQILDGWTIVLPRRARGTVSNDTISALVQYGDVVNYECHGEVVYVKFGVSGWGVRPCGDGVELLANGEKVCDVANTSIRFYRHAQC